MSKKNRNRRKGKKINWKTNVGDPMKHGFNPSADSFKKGSKRQS